jgi:predicted transposase/invertase (TIGR01784 family)
LTTADKHKADVAVIDFDPKDRYGNALGEIKHKVIYLAVKYVDENTPEIYREWLSAIKESLTEQIEETNYHRPELQTVINSIAKNLVSPEEKYAMIEEYNFESDKKKRFEEGEQAGKLKASQVIAKNLLATGLDIETIAQATGLIHTEIENLR